jgi:hypothetical protein
MSRRIDYHDDPSGPAARRSSTGPARLAAPSWPAGSR